MEGADVEPSRHCRFLRLIREGKREDAFFGVECDATGDDGDVRGEVGEFGYRSRECEYEEECF